MQTSKPCAECKRQRKGGCGTERAVRACLKRAATGLGADRPAAHQIQRKQTAAAQLAAPAGELLTSPPSKGCQHASQGICSTALACALLPAHGTDICYRSMDAQRWPCDAACSNARALKASVWLQPAGWSPGRALQSRKQPPASQQRPRQRPQETRQKKQGQMRRSNYQQRQVMQTSTRMLQMRRRR